MRRTNFGSGRGGPLMTNHLQDLELELELLKRKRQLIQQQQSEMLYSNPVETRQTYGQHVQQFENRYNEPQRRNFSNLYDAAPRDSRPFVPKRPAPWANQSGDSFDAPHSSFKKPRQGPNPPSGYFNASPNPPSLFGQSKPFMNRRQPPKSNNSPKNKQAQAPRPNQTNFKRRPKQTIQNKPSSAPSVAPPQASAPQKPYYGTPKEMLSMQEKRKPVVLSDAVEPSHKVNGRLELALGNIVKEIKAAHSEAAHLFNSHTLARIMKKGIRERVRRAMVGKVVGAVPTIVAEYRKQFPPSTDADILELATIKTQKLNENSELAIQLLEEGDPEQYFRKNMKRLLEVKLDELFKQAEQRFTGENAISEAEILDHLPDIKKSHENVKFIRWQDKKGANKEAKEANEEAKEANEEAKEENEEGNENPDEVKEKKDVAVLPKDAEYEKWVSMLIERILPRILPKFKDYIIKFLDLDKMYCATKAAIVTHTNNSALFLAMSRDKKGISAAPSKDDPVLPKNLPYFVKVHAVPSMPKRKQMQEFLNPFKPKTIKRHKKNFNLLFVGFADKEDYDKILLADKSMIGSSTVNIVGTHNTRASLFDSDKRENQNDGDILTPQLDDQINDLLSSIRKADEEANTSNQSEIEQKESVDNDAQDDVESVDNNAQDDVEIVDNKAPDDENNVKETANAKVETEVEKSDNGNVEVEKSDNGNVEVEKSDNGNVEAENGKDSDVEEVTENADVVTLEDEEVAPLRNGEATGAGTPATGAGTPATGAGTPAKGRAPATPSIIRTRRASRLAQNN